MGKEAKEVKEAEYLINELTFADALDDILDTIEAKLKAEIRDEGYLDGVVQVLTGDRDRNIKYPFVMMEEDVASPRTTTFGFTSEWEIPIGLTAFVKHSDPKSGRKAARRLAANARSAVLKKWDEHAKKYSHDRNLGLAFVLAVNEGAAGGTGHLKEDGTTYISVAFVTVRFSTRE